MLAALADVLVFLGTIGALALPGLVFLRTGGPATRLALAIPAGLIAFYLGAWLVYHAGLPWRSLLVLPLAAVAWAWTRRDALRAFAREPALPPLLAAAGLVAAGASLCHALVVSYSGGGWAGDWFEHYQRACFFLLRLPADQTFLDLYLLPARPPLANLLVSGLLGLGSADFASFQLFTTLLSSLVFFPLAALLERRPDAGRATALLAVLLLLNPLFLHNAAYPWTKLIAAVFALPAVLLLWRAPERPVQAAWALPLFAAGCIAHYSIGPWLVAFGVAGLWRLRGHLGDAPLWRHGAFAATVAAALAGTWVAWTLLRYGLASSIEATSTVGHAPKVSWLGQVAITFENLRHTFLPNWDSVVLTSLLQQPHPLSRVRDLGFTLYQQNLPMALGLGNLVALAWLASRPRPRAELVFWLLGGGLVVFLGVAVHTWPVDLGLAHICLQPLVLLGLAGIASGAAALPRWLMVLWGGGLALDFAWGVGLHFGMQSLLLPRLLAPGNSDRNLIWYFTGAEMNNYNGKLRVGEPFLAELLADQRLGLAAAFFLVLGVALWRVAAARAPGAAIPPGLAP